MAVDYFTKWAKVELVAWITKVKAQNFVWKAIISIFGLPRVIITDNGRQFDNAQFTEFYTKLGIDHRFTSVAHLQSNREAKVTNRTIL